MTRFVSGSPFACEVAAQCVICHAWAIPGQPIVHVLPEHGIAHAWHEELI